MITSQFINTTLPSETNGTDVYNIVAAKLGHTLFVLKRQVDNCLVVFNRGDPMMNTSLFIYPTDVLVKVVDQNSSRVILEHYDPRTTIWCLKIKIVSILNCSYRLLYDGKEIVDTEQPLSSFNPCNFQVEVEEVSVIVKNQANNRVLYTGHHPYSSRLGVVHDQVAAVIDHNNFDLAQLNSDETLNLSRQLASISRPLIKLVVLDRRKMVTIGGDFEMEVTNKTTVGDLYQAYRDAYTNVHNFIICHKGTELIYSHWLVGSYEPPTYTVLRCKPILVCYRETIILKTEALTFDDTLGKLMAMIVGAIGHSEFTLHNGCGNICQNNLSTAIGTERLSEFFIKMSPEREAFTDDVLTSMVKRPI